MQTGSSGTLNGWKSGQTTFVPLWDRMEGAWLRTLFMLQRGHLAAPWELFSRTGSTAVTYALRDLIFYFEEGSF